VLERRGVLYEAQKLKSEAMDTGRQWHHLMASLYTNPDSEAAFDYAVNIWDGRSTGKLAVTKGPVMGASYQQTDNYQCTIQ
jgi:hypothetical protein